jgi:hypothetical protein
LDTGFAEAVSQHFFVKLLDVSRESEDERSNAMEAV